MEPLHVVTMISNPVRYASRYALYREFRAHLRRDWQGLWQLADDAWRLRDDIRGYFRARNEDSIDLE